jgi:hypothetical protein
LGQETRTGGASPAAAPDSAQSVPTAETKVYAHSRVSFLKDLYRVASITDRETIRIFNEEFLFADADTLIREIRILDLNKNGFEEGDYVVLEPLGEAIPLTSIPDRIRGLMKEWQVPPQTEFYLQAGGQVDGMLELLGRDNMRANEVSRCKLCALKGLLTTLSKVYYSSPIRIFFQRNPDGTVEADFWDFEESAFAFTDCRAEADTIPFYDVIQITRRDTLLVAERNYFDLIFVSRTDAETLFVEPPSLGAGHGTWEAPPATTPTEISR